MGRNLMTQIANYLSSHRRRKIGYWVLCSLGAVVVFCTTYALILPAITMSNEPICGFEAHVHDESCWSLTPLAPETELICEDWKEAAVVFHTHDSLCYGSEGQLLCPLEERQAHVHSEGCFVEQQELICELPVGEAVEPEPESAPAPVSYVQLHTHTASCYSLQRGGLLCGLEESEGHQHGDACYVSEPTGELIQTCPYTDGQVVGVLYDVENAEGGPVEQFHYHDTSACFEPAMQHVLACGLEEAEGHLHTDECYEWERVLTCSQTEEQIPAEDIGEPDVPEEIPDAHVHGEECYKVTRTKLCGEEEYVLHTHGPECYEVTEVENGMGGFDTVERLICELPVIIEHQHTDACLRQAEVEEGEREVMVRTCNLEYHVHTDECFLNAGPDPDPYYCGLAEHMHTDDCYFESGELRCTIPEHTHTEECMDPDSAPAPEYPMLPGGAEYVCGLEVHMHTDECWIDGELACGMEEHFHSEDCLPEQDDGGKDEQPICGIAEHAHTLECFSEDGELICGQEAHTHDAGCWSQEPDDGETDDPNQDAAELESVEINDIFEVPVDGFVMTVHIDGIARPIVDNNEDNSGEQTPPADQGNAGEQTPPTGQGNASEQTPPTDQDNAGNAVPPADVTPPAQDEVDDPSDTQVQDNEDMTSGDDPESDESMEGHVLSMGSMSLVSYAAPESGDLPLPPSEDDIQDGNNPADDFSDTFGSITNPWQETTSSTVGSENSSQIQLTLEEVTEGEEYEAIKSQLDESRDDETLIGEPKVMEIVATINGKMLDLTGCTVTVELKPSEELVEAIDSVTNISTMDEVDMETANTPADTTAPVDGDAGADNNNPSIAVDFFTQNEEPQTKLLDAEEVREGGATVNFTFTVQKRAMYCTRSVFTPNPNFTVQFYVDIATPLSDSTTGVAEDLILPFINTSANGDGKSPSLVIPNGDKALPQKYLILNEDGSIKFNREVRKLYVDEPREFNPKLEDDFDTEYLNSLRDNDHYTLEAVWILKDGCDASSTNENDWVVKSAETELKFTNNSITAAKDTSGNTILIQQDGSTVVRLMYKSRAGADKDLSARFYDYDISNGTYTKAGNVKTMETGKAGINDTRNCASDVKLAFGNKLLSDYGEIKWETWELNKANSASFNDCTFGLVQASLDSEGNILFNVDAPDLFTDTHQEGKARIPEINSLRFKREGDTYTLTSVPGAPGQSATSLDYFRFKRMNWNNTRRLWSNNFWPADAAEGWGKDGHDIKFGLKGQKDKAKLTNGTINSLYESDDGTYHNPFFGMTFSVDFRLVPEYLGPLEYYFYGDDDMWAYLTYPDGTSKLVCDIGGVHGSVGEYVDLWDYIDHESIGKDGATYRLSFFYTERGASGSTCWMQFTLPNINEVRNKPYDPNRASLTITKECIGAEGDVVDTSFDFTLRLSGIYNSYKVKRFDADGNEIQLSEAESSISTAEYPFSLKSGERLEVIDLPIDTTYWVEEKYSDANCSTSVTIGDKTEATVIAHGKLTGTVVGEGDDKKDKVDAVTVAYTNSFLYTLPETGGPTARMYTLGGALLILAAGGLVYKKKSERRGAAGKN